MLVVPINVERNMSSAKQGECDGECMCDGECQDELHGVGVVSYLTDKFSKFNVALKGRPKLINDLMESTKGVPVVWFICY